MATSKRSQYTKWTLQRKAKLRKVYKRGGRQEALRTFPELTPSAIDTALSAFKISSRNKPQGPGVASPAGRKSLIAATAFTPPLSSARFNPMKPDPKLIHLEDIAHALGMLCRFNGHIRYFYSVAEHSILVSRLLPDHLKLDGLLHDAAEAYISDLATPIKYAPEMAAYRRLDDSLTATIRAALGFPAHVSDHVKEAIKIADRTMLRTEVRALCADPDAWTWGASDPKEVSTSIFSFFAPERAGREFLTEFRRLQRRQQAVA